MTNLTAKALKLAGILVVPAWSSALRRHGVSASDGDSAFTNSA